MKRKFTKLTALLLAALMLTALVPIGIGVRADEEGIFTYTVEGVNAQIMSCNTDASGNVVIPDKLGGCTVTSIAQNAFANCRNITGVEIPDTVTSIGESAFTNCYGLESVKLPSGLEELGAYAFSCCDNLLDVSFGTALVRIGAFAFQNTAFIKNEANWDSGFLYKDTVLIKADSSVVSGNITVKSGTTCIADHAFESCTQIVTVILPSTLKGIGGGTFRNCTNLEKADLSATKIKALPNCDTQPYVYGTFQNCTKLSDVLLPSML